MTELDAEIGPLALELIDEYGKEVLYQIVTAGAYDPATASAAPAGEYQLMKAIVEDYSLQGSGQAFASGLVESGDKKLTIAGALFVEAPTPGDLVTIDGGVYTVLNVKAVYSGELVAIYEIQCRK